MDQHTKLFAFKADSLILISRSYRIEIGNPHLQVVLDLHNCTTVCMLAETYTYK